MCAGRLGAILEPSSGCLGASLGHLGAILGTSWASWLGTCRCHLAVAIAFAIAFAVGVVAIAIALGYWLLASPTAVRRVLLLRLLLQPTFATVSSTPLLLM